MSGSTLLELPLRSLTSSPSRVRRLSARIQRRTLPYRTDLGPAALVDTIPPSVAQRQLDGSGGSLRPCTAAAAWRSCRVTLQLVTAVRDEGSTRSCLGIPVRSTIKPSPTFPPPMALPAPRGMRATLSAAAHSINFL